MISRCCDRARTGRLRMPAASRAASGVACADLAQPRRLGEARLALAPASGCGASGRGRRARRGRRSRADERERLETPIAPAGRPAAALAAVCFGKGTLAVEIVSPRLGTRPAIAARRSAAAPSAAFAGTDESNSSATCELVDGAGRDDVCADGLVGAVARVAGGVRVVRCRAAAAACRPRRRAGCSRPRRPAPAVRAAADCSVSFVRLGRSAAPSCRRR